MAIRLSGLISGMDTEALVSSLMEGHSAKKTKLQKSKTKLEWKQEIWKDLNKEIYSFYTDQVSKMRLQGQYTVKSVASTDESKATATAAQGAVNGNYRLKVKQLSSSQSWTSGKLGAGVTEKTTLSELGISEGTVFRMQVGVSDKGSGTSANFTVKEESTLGDLISACKNAGLNASFDKDQNRLYIGSKESGENEKFELTSYASDSTYSAAMQSLKDGLDYSNRTSKEQQNILNAVGVLTKYSEDEISQKLMDEEWTQDEYDAYVSNQDAAKEYLENFVTGAVNLDSMINDIYSSKGADSQDALSVLKLTSDTGATKVEAKDSIIEYNGTEYTSSTNDFSINNVKLNVKNVTDDDGITLTVATDTESAYKMIKDFVGAYNTLVDRLSTLYNAKRAKGYEPLTDDEKSAMTDDQIKQWEDKIKSSLLRRDESVNSLMTSMRSALATTVTVDGKKYSLATFGITTDADYTEYGKLHIYGDSDDSDYADKTKKLQDALEKDPETVAKVISGVTQNLYTTMYKKMQASTLRTAMSFYNDKQATKQVDQYEKDIKSWTEKLEDMEDRYYSQFTAMEKSMASLNSQGSYLSGMMGSGS